MRKLEWEDGYGEVDDITIRRLEKELGVVFPKDYKECVKQNQGAKPTLDCFRVNGIERVFGALLVIKNPEDGRAELLDDYLLTKNKLPKGIIPFADDPAGNQICFDYNNHEDNPIVVFWEHEGAWEKELIMKEEGITEEQAEEVARNNIYYVASSFTEFLEMLYEG